MHVIQPSPTAALLGALTLLVISAGCHSEIESPANDSKENDGAVPIRVVAVSETKLAPAISQPAVVHAWQEAEI